MGNRGGRFHRPDQTLGRRRWASRQWISCLCAFQGRHRDVWGASYTELFFLDEPTALAAGHRPCFLCRRADAEAFRRAFARERRAAARRRSTPFSIASGSPTSGRRAERPIAELPDGAMIARNGRPLRPARRDAAAVELLRLWSAGAATRRWGRARVLTPPSIVAALRRGYRPRWAEDLV